ncbi:hypothetical protein FRZ44_21480 [Hypericibacter terrae]|uniref:Integrase n=1 Tax=Hypericibacter terrae TaxID=2602015 RepID=A0A5J6MH90_9PROT|nr:DUF6538 domain-containing protein [Hypericibacter terrae]QEX16853.1 hypothetical protein FRZ44_21480 [Hypericibacter terrae]
MPAYIQKRRRRWYAVLEIPEAVREAVGKPRFVKSLQTESETVARRRALPLVALWKRQIEKANGNSPLIAEAQRWRQSITEEIERGNYDDELGPIVPLLLGDRAEEIEKKHGTEAAGLFYSVATGDAVMIEDMADKWLAEAGYPEKGAYQHRRALAVLTARHKTVGEMDRKTVGAFVTDVLAQGRKAATANRIISTYSALWRWLERRGHVEGNPWLNQRLAVKGDNGDRRAFTEAEAIRFLAALDGVDRDVVSVAAVTGMRLEEITGLEPADVTANGKVVWLEVREGKTKAAARRVPVVAPSVRKMLLDRKAAGHASPAGGRGPKLFHELKPDRFGDYGSALSKRVGRKLRSIGLTDPHLVADHSWRHRARTLMEHADVMPWVADALIGHKRPGEGLGRYSKGPSEEQLVAAVKAIKLPAM